MNLEKARYYSENMDKVMRTDRVFLNNPVMIAGIGLAPIIVTATTLHKALIIGLAVILLLTPTRVLASALSGYVNPRFKAMLYSICAAVIFIPVYFIEKAVFGVGLELVGLYLPLLVVEPIIIKRYERSQREPLSIAFKKGIRTTGGFLVALFIIAATREFLSSGELFGFAIMNMPLLPISSYACGGFIIAGILAAFWRTARNIFKRYISVEAKQEL